MQENRFWLLRSCVSKITGNGLVGVFIFLSTYGKNDVNSKPKFNNIGRYRRSRRVVRRAFRFSDVSLRLRSRCNVEVIFIILRERSPPVHRSVTMRTIRSVWDVTHIVIIEFFFHPYEIKKTSIFYTHTHTQYQIPVLSIQHTNTHTHTTELYTCQLLLLFINHYHHYRSYPHSFHTAYTICKSIAHFFPPTYATTKIIELFTRSEIGVRWNCVYTTINIPTQHTHILRAYARACTHSTYTHKHTHARTYTRAGARPKSQSSEFVCTQTCNVSIRRFRWFDGIVYAIHRRSRTRTEAIVVLGRRCYRSVFEEWSSSWSTFHSDLVRHRISSINNENERRNARQFFGSSSINQAYFISGIYLFLSMYTHIVIVLFGFHKPTA